MKPKMKHKSIIFNVLNFINKTHTHIQSSNILRIAPAQTHPLTE